MDKLKKIILPIITLVLTLLALTTTTFAWFTLSKVATVSNIEAEVMAGEGLEIALGLNGDRLTPFRTNLNKSDWETVYNKLDQFKFSAVTTNDLESYTKLVYSSNERFGPGLFQEEAIKNEDYIEFDIFFKSNTKGIINLSNYKLDGDIIEFIPKVEYIQNENSNDTLSKNKVITKASSALRVSINELVLQDDKNEYNTHITNTVVKYGQYSYINQLNNYIYWKDSNNDYYKVSEENLEEIKFIKANSNIESITENLNIKLDQKEDKDYISKATIKMWIEGWDADAYDSIFGGKINVNLTFKKENIN